MSEATVQSKRWFLGFARIDGEVAFRQHSGGHTTGPNWPTFLKFADRYLKDPAADGPDKR